MFGIPSMPRRTIRKPTSQGLAFCFEAAVLSHDRLSLVNPRRFLTKDPGNSGYACGVTVFGAPLIT
jgi:hypothetical protein